jgi:GH24 family phage-related lysozyme (muramidase)
MSREILRNYIEINEGLRHKVYLCPMGVKTIGIGFNLERYNANEQIYSIGLNYNDVISGMVSLTTEQIYQLLDKDIDTSILTANTLFKNFTSLSIERQIILVDMAFNRGQTRLSGFIKLIAAINAEKWHRAAAEMENLLWAKQVVRRALLNINGMKNNCLPGKIY